MSENVPNELLYTEDHEWVRQEGNLVTVGHQAISPSTNSAT